MALGVSSQKYASIVLLLVIIFVSLAMGNMSMFSGRSGGGRGGIGMSERAHIGMNSQGVYAGGAVSAGYQENMNGGPTKPPRRQ
jgi:hypothetical protein